MSPARPKRVLVIDDNLPLRVLISHALEAAGYVALAAESGEAALEVVRFDPPDLCLVDQCMPGMTGAAFIRTLRTSPDERLRHIPAIGLTGYEEAARDLVEAGACCAMQKPCGDGPLLETIATVLAAPAAG